MGELVTAWKFVCLPWVPPTFSPPSDMDAAWSLMWAWHGLDMQATKVAEALSIDWNVAMALLKTATGHRLIYPDGTVHKRAALSTELQVTVEDRKLTKVAEKLAKKDPT